MLKQKDNDVAQIGVYNHSNYIDIEIDKVIDESKLPYGFTNIHSFIESRKPPRNRVYLEPLLASVPHGQFPGGFLKTTLGLSLNDTYWFVNSDFPDLEWDKYNLYNNPFSEVLSGVAFTGHPNRVQGVTPTPEYTTNGMLKKCWRIHDGKIKLYKAGTSGASNTGFEPYSEYYSCQILDKLDIPHIAYDLEKFHGELVSTCECFCNENLSYAPIYKIMTREEWETSDVYQALDDRMKYFGEREFKDMFLFDYIVYNYDRHLGNFGVYYNQDTKEILSPAKVYDNGVGLLAYETENSLNQGKLGETQIDIRDYIGYMSFDHALQYLIDGEMKEKARKLINFKFKKHERYNLNDSRLKALEEFIKGQVEKVLDYDIKNQKFGENSKPSISWS